VLSFGADSISVEYKDRTEMVFAHSGGVGERIAAFPSSSSEAKELRQNLYAAAKKQVRTVIEGKVYILKVRVYDSFGEDAFDVAIDPAPELDPAAAPSFTPKQGQYLSFIYHYSKIHGQAPAESDIERYFRVSPPSVHEMIKTLERNGLIRRTPRQARSIRLLVRPEYLPRLK
jgi:repressor LexA